MHSVYNLMKGTSKIEKYNQKQIGILFQLVKIFMKIEIKSIY